MTTTMTLGEDYPEIREAIRAICKDFPGSYWRQVEDGHVRDALRRPDDAGRVGGELEGACVEEPGKRLRLFPALLDELRDLVARVIAVDDFSAGELARGRSPVSEDGATRPEHIAAE